jgi:hydrogenase-4 component B
MIGASHAPVGFFSATFLVLVFLPIVLGISMLVRRWRPVIVAVAPWAAVPALLAAWLMPVDTAVEWKWLLLGTRFGLDAVGQTFLFFTAILWLAAGLYGRAYLAKDENAGRFFGFYLLAMAGNMGLIVALDAVGFYAFFALMSFSSYGLVIHNQDAKALYAGKIYIYLVIVGEVLLFSALTVIVTAAGSTFIPISGDIDVGPLALFLALAGFGIKVGMLPLHFWLPLAHPVAPTPASAVLSGAMIKAGLLGWLRFFPMGEIANIPFGFLLAVLGLGAAFYGVVIGLWFDNPKTVLAYSSISQMGIMTFGVSLGFMAPSLWPSIAAAVSFYAFHHAMVKGALFLGVGLAGKGTQFVQGVIFVGLGWLAMSMAGFPGTSGDVAKTALKSLLTFNPSPLVAWVAPLLALSSLGTAVLMGRYLFLMWPRGGAKGILPIGLWMPWALLLVTSMVIVFR